MKQGSVVVIDVGKTVSKVSLWSECGRLIDRRTRPNRVVRVADIARLDVEGISSWLIESLRAFRGHPIRTIIPVGHGAAVVALAGSSLAYAPLDYEQAIPAEAEAEYRALRDPFAQTGSPLLPLGLNFGAQLFWLDRLYPQARSAMLLPWAQYWAWFLTGRAVSEISSLGCHSDIWNYQAQQFSSLAQAQGWAARFAPLVRAGDVVGTLKPELAAATGLAATVAVLAGVHDSNAALLAARGHDEIDQGEATILSTGTWFIAMRATRGPVATSALSEARDCLVNIDVEGRPVLSARFMGGREIEMLISEDRHRVDIAADQAALLDAVPAVIANAAMVMPTLVAGCGPFPKSSGQWRNCPDDWLQRRAAVCLYAALVAETIFELIGTSGRVLVEGRFANADVFVRALASLRPDLEILVAQSHNDVSFGALRLVSPALKAEGALQRVAPLDHDLSAYRQIWRNQLDSRPW